MFILNVSTKIVQTVCWQHGEPDQGVNQRHRQQCWKLLPGLWEYDTHTHTHTHCSVSYRLLHECLTSVCLLVDAQPSLSESAVWEKVNQVLTEAQVILEDLQAYRGAGEEIRQVIYSHTVCESVTFMQLSTFISLRQILHFLLHYICLTALVTSYFSVQVKPCMYSCWMFVIKWRMKFVSLCAEKILLLLQLNKGWRMMSCKMHRHKAEHRLFSRAHGPYGTTMLKNLRWYRPWCIAAGKTSQQYIKSFRWTQASTSAAVKCNKHMKAAGTWERKTLTGNIFLQTQN